MVTFLIQKQRLCLEIPECTQNALVPAIIDTKGLNKHQDNMKKGEET